MKPAPFEYHAPDSLEEALTLAQTHGFDGKLLAGGQSLIPVMNFRLAQPTALIDLNPITSLDFIETTADNSLRIGAMVRQSRLEKSTVIQTHAPLIHQTMPVVAHSQIRNRGTIGGSLAHADPAGELPVLAVALNAEFKLQKVGAERWVSASEFYQDLFETALLDDEILTEIIIPPAPARTGYGFHELARRHGDYAQAGAAAVLTFDESQVCTAAKLVFLNVGPIPMDAKNAAQMLVGNKLSEELIKEVSEACKQEIDPVGDLHGSAEYKSHLASVMVKRAIVDAKTISN